MKKEELIKKLESTVLPEIEVQSHRRRLRMALLSSKLFKKQAEGGVFSLAKSKIKGGVEMATKVWKPAAIGALVAAVIFAVLFLMPIQFPGGPVSAEKGKAVFVISDAAAEMGVVSSINVTIGSIEVHREGAGWITVSTEEQTYDLLELKAEGTAKLLVETDLEVGTYDQVRLNVSKVIIVDSSGSHEAKLPSNKLQLKGSFEVKQDATTTINFDFIADQSLHLTGEGRYILAPVIQLETHKDAEVDISTNRKVQVSGGHIIFHARLGMDTEGNMDSGVVISPDAALTIDVSGKVAQVKGHVLVMGTIKGVDTEKGTITVATKAGKDITLHLASDSQLVVDGSVSTLAALENKIGSKVRLQYNIETKAIANADVGATAETSTSLTLRGTVSAVSIPARTITIVTESGTEVTLQVDRSVAIQVNLAAKIGAWVTVEYNTETGTVTRIEILVEVSPQKVSASGTLKAVHLQEGTITIGTEEGDITLKVVSGTQLRVDGTIPTLATLATKIGSRVTVEYNAEMKVAFKVRVEAQASVTATGTIKAVAPSAGTITITTNTGTDIVLNVTSATRIEVNGTISNLGSLFFAPIGSRVSVEYDAQTNTAISINVR